MRATALFAILALSCSPPMPLPELYVKAGGPWPKRVPVDEFPGFNQSLTDSAGFAGLAVEVLGIGQTKRLTAPDFTIEWGGGMMGANAIAVPESGEIGVVVVLNQNGTVAAEVAVSWTLEPDTDWWELQIRRVPHELLVPVGNRRWVVPIRAHAQNYEGEVLWVSLTHVEYCPGCVY